MASIHTLQIWFHATDGQFVNPRGPILEGIIIEVKKATSHSAYHQKYHSFTVLAKDIEMLKPPLHGLEGQIFALNVIKKLTH